MFEFLNDHAAEKRAQVESKALNDCAAQKFGEEFAKSVADPSNAAKDGSDRLAKVASLTGCVAEKIAEEQKREAAAEVIKNVDSRLQKAAIEDSREMRPKRELVVSALRGAKADTHEQSIVDYLKSKNYSVSVEERYLQGRTQAIVVRW